MYAIIINGTQQYRVKEGQTIKVEKIEQKTGAEIEINKILMIIHDKDVQLGTPYLKTYTVKASIEGHGRNKKISMLKFKRRKHHLKRMGHRQWFTSIKITSIQVKDSSRS